MLLRQWSFLQERSLIGSFVHRLIKLDKFFLLFVGAPNPHNREEDLNQVKGKAYLQGLVWASTKLDNGPHIDNWSKNVDQLVNAESISQQESPYHLEEFLDKWEWPCYFTWLSQDAIRWPSRLVSSLISAIFFRLGHWILFELNPVPSIFSLGCIGSSSKTLEASGSNLHFFCWFLDVTLWPN